MKKGTTSNGFAFEFDERRADDMRFVDLIVSMSGDDVSEFDKLAASSKMIEMLLGKEQKAALFDFIGQSYDGRVPFLEVEIALKDIMNSGGNSLKN